MIEMIAAALIAVTVCCVVLVIYPYLIYPMVLRLLPSVPVFARRDHNRRFSLVFCAYNEARSIKEKIANIETLKARYPDLEVLAFDDGSSDETFDLLSQRADLIKVVRGGGRYGKARGMKRLASQATGDILVFTDANVILAEDALDNLAAYYADVNIGGVCGSLKYIGDDTTSTAAVGSLYWRLEEYLKKEESRTGNVMGADGSIFSLRRELYPNFPDTVLDDLTVSMAAVFASKRLLKVEDVLAYERLVTERKEEFSRKIRIASRAFHTHMYLRPQLKGMSWIDKYKYASRKYVRWFGGAFLILGFLACIGALLIVSLPLALCVTLVAAVVVCIGYVSTRGTLAALVEIAIALIATLVGIAYALKGKTSSVWTPAKSR